MTEAEKKELLFFRGFKEYFDDLWGKGLEVKNWHSNGGIEPFDSFYNSAIEWGESRRGSEEFHIWLKSEYGADE